MATGFPRIVGAAEEDPLHYATWSGSSAYFFSALKETGHLSGTLSGQPSQMLSRWYQLRNFHPNLNKWKFKYYLDTDHYERMSRIALSQLRAMDFSSYEVILQIGALLDLSQQPGKLTVSYHDGNLAALLASPYGYPRISQRRINHALKHERALYARLDHIFTMSEWLADSFVRDFGVARSKITPIGAGINLPHIREITDKSYESPAILFVGKAFERKGGRYLLEAFQKVRQEIPRATLTLIGPELSSLPHGVRCLSYISKRPRKGLELLLDEYANASVFTLPSLYEPFGISFAEAMAHRLPCVGTRICAMPEIIRHRSNGLLVPPGDSRALSEALICLLKDAARCKEYGEQGYKDYLTKYKWSCVADNLLRRLRT